MDRIQYAGSGELWVSDIQSVAESSTSRFDCVVSVCQDTVRDNVGCRYRHFCLADGERSSDEWGGSYDYESFAAAMDWLYDRLQTGKSVIIHCHRGRSRSVAVSMGALGRLLDLRPHDSFGLVKDYRTQANPDELLYEHASRYIEEHV